MVTTSLIVTKRLRKGVSLKALIILLLIHVQIVKFLDRDEAVAGKWSFVERLHGRLLKYWSSVIGDILSNPAHCAQCTVQWREREKCKLVSLVCSSTVQRSQLKWMTASTERGETGKCCDQPALGHCDQYIAIQCSPVHFD